MFENNEFFYILALINVIILYMFVSANYLTIKFAFFKTRN